MKNLLNGAEDSPLFYDMKETCTILKLARKTLEKLVEIGAIKAFNVGTGTSKIYRFTPDSIYEFINGGNQTTTTTHKNIVKKIDKKLKSSIIKKTNPFARA